MVKVHFWPLACSLLLLVVISNCQTPPPEDTDYDRRRFGDPYEIITNSPPAAPDAPPELSADTLSALLSYEGGCADHDFVPDYEISGDTSRIWLFHDARGDDCEGMLMDEVVTRIPSSALEAPTIVLLNPNDPEPFMLRWGRPNSNR